MEVVTVESAQQLTPGDVVIWKRASYSPRGSSYLVRGEFWYRTPEKVAIKIKTGADEIVTRFADPKDLRRARTKGIQ